MRAVIQRVSRASVEVQGEIVGRIGRGLVVLVGVDKEDTETDARYVAGKITTLRVFADEHGKMNLAVDGVGGGLLVLSQFTLLGDTHKGRRPGFEKAAPPERARALYDAVVDQARASGVRVETGRFGALMHVELVNDGPVTLIVDSRRS